MPRYLDEEPAMLRDPAREFVSETSHHLSPSKFRFYDGSV
jgi:hypothetical protein